MKGARPSLLPLPRHPYLLSYHLTNHQSPKQNVLKYQEKCEIPRYKIIVQVTLGQMKDQGVRVASRALWDTATDNYASVEYANVSEECGVECV